MDKSNRHSQCYMKEKCEEYDICPMVRVQNLFGGKWKLLIVWYLSYGTLRFSEIKSKLPDVTQKMLTQCLRSLETDGIVIRVVFPVVPPRVEYSLSDIGIKMLPILELMHGFGVNYLENITNNKSVDNQSHTLMNK